MANFDRSGMTQAGINLMGKAIGGATIQFTKLVLGDGEMTGEILDLQGVVSPKQNVDVTRIERNDNQCTVGGELLTSAVKQGFFWREAGLYAMDPDVGEILYNYAYSTKPDYIAASDSGMMEEILVSMVATVGSNTNVDVTIDDSMVFATKKVVDKKPYYYNSIDDMKSDITLKEGDMAITLGYYEANDNGEAKYLISSDGVADDLLIITMRNGLKAHLIYSDGVVNVNKIGLKGDGVFDNCNKLDQVIATVNSGVLNTLIFDKGVYLTTKSLPIITGRVCFKGFNQKETTVLYKAQSDSTFIKSVCSAQPTDFNVIVDNITIKLAAESKNYYVHGIDYRRIVSNGPYWGARMKIYNSSIIGFTGDSVCIYIPYQSIFKNTIFEGQNFEKNAENPKVSHPNSKAKGLVMIAHDSTTNTDTFGNVNLIESCTFGKYKHGVEMVAVGATTFSNCTFEPCFINAYVRSGSGSKSWAKMITFDNCWNEDPTLTCHPDFGGLLMSKYNELTGEVMLDNGNLVEQASVIYNTSQFHSSCKVQDLGTNFAYIQGMNLNYTLKTEIMKRSGYASGSDTTINSVTRTITPTTEMLKGKYIYSVTTVEVRARCRAGNYIYKKLETYTDKKGQFNTNNVVEINYYDPYNYGKPLDDLKPDIKGVSLSTSNGELVVNMKGDGLLNYDIFVKVDLYY